MLSFVRVIASMPGALFIPSPGNAVDEGTSIHVCAFASGSWGYAMVRPDGQWAWIGGAGH